jgi:SagB-type dehydrogenase family enzyme
MLAYHEATKHTVERLRRSPHTLDWDNMPDPFRRYDGAPVLDLPPDGPHFLSNLFFHACAISASKVSPTGMRYALRVNPSSGNLHPTEFHFATRGLSGWPDGVFHYRPDAHVAEQRATGALFDAPLTVLLTTIAWREAWKYRSRAYRYCLLDLGHAWQALVSAAGWLGCPARARFRFADQAMAERFRLPQDEWPMLVLEIFGQDLAVDDRAAQPLVWTPGTPNSLSTETIEYALIHEIHRTTSLEHDDPEEVPLTLPSVSALSDADLPRIVRQRRSALDFEGGSRTISLTQLEALLACAGDDFITLYVYVHRVEGLAAGVYSHHELLRAGDQRLAAAGLSLGQDLAANACVTFSMVADLKRALAVHGMRGYRLAHFQAGTLGQRLYLASEAMGLRSTGIGAFYDDRVHDFLGLTPDQGQVVYHFATGYPVDDARLEG